MAGLFDYEDPESVGRMMFAAGLLNAAGPQKMPVSVGQALAQGLMGRQQAASEAGQNQRRNRLTDAHIAKALAEAKYGNAPASVRTALWYANDASPQERAAYQSSVRAQEKQMIGGVLHVKDFDTKQWRPANPLEEQLSIIEQSAGRQELGKQAVAARYDVQPTFDPATGQDMFTNRSAILQGMGAIPPQRPQLSAFNPPALAGAPRIGGPNPQAAGLDSTNGYPSTQALGTAIDEATQRFAGAVPSAAPQVNPQAGLRPPSAGDATRAGNKVTAEVKAKATAEAGIGLQKLTDETSYAIDLLGKLKSHPGMKFAVGDVLRGSVPALAGEQANFVALHNQVRGQAFLRAYEGLKGTGSITEIEGKTATEAIARMERAQSAEAYIEAANELESVLKKGLERTRTRAGSGRPAPGGTTDSQVINFNDLPTRR